MTETRAAGSGLVPGGIDILQPGDVENLRVPWDARYSRSEIEELAAQEPPLSLWNRRSGGFLLGGQWRHRTEIANVIDISGPSIAVELLTTFVQRAEQLGFQLAIVAEYAERRRESFYAAAGLAPIEDIVVYELGRVPQLAASGFDDEGYFVTVVDLREREQRSALLTLDHRAFPWLWWNSAGEFDNYGSVPGVEIVLVRRPDGAPLGYIGTTSLGSWGHLDRIAVDPAAQGQGFGRRLLALAIERLQADGARRVALSTQASNRVSRALYESVGFRRSRSHDYRIYGRELTGQHARDDELPTP